MKIICCSETRNVWPQLLTAALPEAEVVEWRDDQPAQDADIAVVWRPPAQLFERERKLRAVFNLGAGVDGLLKLPTLPPELPVVRLEDAGMAVQMSEYVVHYLTGVSRHFAAYAAQQRAATWKPLPELRRDEWPVGVLGMGAMGAHVARTLAALEYPVAGWSRSGKAPEGVEAFGGVESLPAFLARTRVLVNLLPLTPDTESLLRRETLSQLLPGAYLINLGRGPHLVEEDLVPLLDSGQLAGAALDVFRQEPLPADHPFWTDPRIAITPHVGATSLQRETVAQITKKIRALMRGEAVTGVVGRDRGY
ncbi:2-hydroxyacid dehydrogenase [Bordetella genomosp. 13]|uniref:2-hydroxyacid dehydrogenase n=1 Tax=Bordetella genomosp. 13 TaxID=463040 RepID=UPI0021B55AB5|nr:glyoxylate/hydroxypyruvate reductase A [Bordetella genomosp. 13]